MHYETRENRRQRRPRRAHNRNHLSVSTRCRPRATVSASGSQVQEANCLRLVQAGCGKFFLDVWYFLCYQAPLHRGRGRMIETFPQLACLPGCHSPVPDELAAEGLCTLHFTLSVEKVCAAMRRETVTRSCSADRQTEIGVYVRSTAEKLSRVAVLSPPLSDEMKKRVLATFLTLMNLQESLVRAAKASCLELAHPAPSAPRPLAASAACAR